MRPSSLRRPRGVALLAFAGLLAACEIPSEAPILQQTWVLPGDSVTVAVAQILPSNIFVSGGGTTFSVNMPAPVTVNTTLAALCAQAACQSGVTVSAPVPAFTSPANLLNSTVTLPATVASATVSGGTLNLSITNNLGFDPLRPNGVSAPFGTLAVTVTSGATTSTTNFSGATGAIPNGATTPLTVTLPTGAYTGSITVSVAANVPAGGTASLNGANAFSVASSVSGLTVTQASVVVLNEAIATTPTSYDLQDVDFADQVESGGLILDILNPFTASAAVTVSISAPATPSKPAVNITRPINIAATPTSTTTLTLTKPELQSLVGRSGVTIAVTGTANGTGAGNTTTVTPASKMVLRTKLQLVLNVGA